MLSGIPLISLYSGIGGLDSGFAATGFAPYFANDTDSKASEAYNSVIAATVGGVDSSHEYVIGDISSNFFDLARNNEAVLVGGPPCQGFSRAGRMDPLDTRSKHVRHFMDAVAAVSPRAFVMENVAALATNAKWMPILRGVRRAALRAGYSTALIVLDAADYGVPQSRKRMFLIGIRATMRADLRLLRVPTTQRVRTSIREAFLDIPPYAQQPDSLKTSARITPAVRPVLRVSPYAGMPFNGQGRFLNLDDVAPTVSASLGGNHTPIVDQAWLDEPSEGGAAIRAYMEALRGGRRPGVETSWRRLSVPEAGRLQGFPSTMQWSTPKSVAYRQIGNAVPPPLAAEVAHRLQRALNGAHVMSEPLEQRDLAA